MLSVPAARPRPRPPAVVVCVSRPRLLNSPMARAPGPIRALAIGATHGRFQVGHMRPRDRNRRDTAARAAAACARHQHGCRPVVGLRFGCHREAFGLDCSSGGPAGLQQRGMASPRRGPCARWWAAGRGACLDFRWVFGTFCVISCLRGHRSPVDGGGVCVVVLLVTEFSRRPAVV